MKVNQGLRAWMFAATAVLASSLASPAVARGSAASSPPTPSATAGAAVRAAEGTAEKAHHLAVGRQGVTAEVGSGDVHISTDPARGAVVDDGGAVVQIGVPGPNRDRGTIARGSVVHDDVAEDAAVVVRPTGEGVQSLVVVEGAEAPTSYRFPIEVDGAPARLASRTDGSVEVRPAGSSRVVAVVLPAWATDARGRPVPTRFQLRGGSLVQVIDHRGATYPVTADPNTCGWVTCTYYFGKKATRDIARSSVFGGGCGLLRVIPLAAGGCFASFGAVHAQANRAVNRKICLKIKYSRVPAPVWYPDIYGDRKYCK